MTNTFKTFALVGAGGAIGKPVLTSLIASSASKVVVLSRADSTATFASNAKLTIERVKQDDVGAVAAVLKKHAVDVLISTVGWAGLQGQMLLVDAAKQTGVQLFVPSEFGNPTEGWTEGLLAAKDNTAKHAKSIGLPTLRVYNGLFIEDNPFVNAVSEKGTFYVLKPGDKPFSLTSLSDIGDFLAYALTTLPPPKLNDATFRIEGDRLSLAELGAVYGELKSVPVEHVDQVPDDLSLAGFINYIGKEFNSGAGAATWDHVQGKDLGTGALSNGLWEGHAWKSVRDVFAK